MVDGHHNHGVCSGLQLVDARVQGRDVDADVGEEAWLTDQHGPPAHPSAYPGAGDRREVLDVGHGQAPLLSGGDNGAGQRVLRRAFRGCG